MAEHTKYQQKVIRSYYDNRETIALQRLQELVTELYLTEGKKREKHWDSVALHLGKLGVKQDTIDHLRRENKPELVATLIKKMMEKSL
jgi:SRSO17 transposase